MYTYKLYVVVIYLLSFRWYVCAPEPVAATAKTNVTFDLSKLNEHGPVTEDVDGFRLKVTTFTTPDDKVVDKVVYDGADVWVSSSDGNKVLKKLVSVQRGSILQLLHLVLSSTTGDATQEVNEYFKKERTRFTTTDATDYNKLKTKLGQLRNHYVNKWYPMDFAKTELHSASTKEQRDLDDGVWKYNYTPLHGSVSVVKHGSNVIWTNAETDKKLSSLELLEFGNNNFLLTLVAAGEKSFYHKSHPSTTWETLENSNAFETKATAFKLNYFPKKIEYDLSTPPNKTHFYVKRSQFKGNHNELYLYTYREFFLGHVKYKNKSLWDSEKDKRVLYLKMNLLYHEVKTVQVVYSLPSTGPFPEKKAAYFYKDADGAFKEVSDRTEFGTHVNKVKAAVDTSTPFVYNDAWPSRPKPLDLSNFNPEDLTVVTNDLTNGVTAQTLTAKSVVPLNGLNFSGVVLWPTGEPAVTNPDVKEVVVVSKNSLPQFVHLKATKAGAAPSNAAVEVNLYFKKVGENFSAFAETDNFEQLKTGLVSGTQAHDTHVHLDLNLQTLNKDLYDVTNQYVDGVDRKVVTPKNVKVTKVFSYRSDLWVRPSTSSNLVLKKYEMYSYADKKLLKLHLGTPEEAAAFTEEYHEKLDPNVSWTKFTTNFNDKLVSFKSLDTLTALELDVSVSPSLTDYRVEVKSLGGNKTKLTLVPAPGKKLTKVKLGTNDFFTAAADNRAYKVELHLEDYLARFVKVFVWKDVANSSPQLTEQKHFKDLTATPTTWVNTNFDDKLREFEAAVSTVAFTYNANWVLPPMTFDFKKVDTDYFQVADETVELVKTTTYTPLLGTVVNKVLLDGAKVWPEGDAPDATKKLSELKVLSKNDMVQLVHLKNVVVATPTTTEDLYYKKETDSYVKLANEAEFNNLKASLSTADTYIDDKVKLDLSATEEASTKLFEKETTLEDGVQKTVVVVKAGKLFQVSASPPLWTSDDGSYVTRLERYVLDLTQFLVLHITKPSGATETKFFEKPVQPPAPAVVPVPGPDSSGVEGPRAEVPPQAPQELAPEQRAQEQRVEQVTPAPSAAPSFAPLDGKNAFFTKLNQAKATVVHQEVPLDVSAYTDNTKFDLKQTTEGTATLHKVYPKKPYWVTRLLNTSGVELWAKNKDGDRLVEAFLYVHDSKLKFVKAVVWAKDHTDESQDTFLHFKLENEKLVDKEADVFAKELRQLTTVPPTPLSTEKYAQPQPTPYSFHKFYLSDKVDTDVFELTERSKGVYKLKNYTTKENKFVNVVETQHGVLWKAEDREDYMKSTFFAVTQNSALAHLTLNVNSKPLHLFFKFEKEKWARLDSSTYVDLYTKAGLTSASS